MKTAFAKSSICLLLVAATFAFVGCGPKISRCVLSGTVTTDGEPVPVGTVLFIPENPDPKLQVSGGSADIVDGKYTLTPETGLVPGKYHVVLGLFELNEMGAYEDLDVVENAMRFEIVDSENELQINWLLSYWGKMKLKDLEKR